MASSEADEGAASAPSFTIDVVADFARLGVSVVDNASHDGMGGEWHLDRRINHDYSLCSTYPSVLALPALASEELLRAVAQYRSRGRLPVLSWRDAYSGVSLIRSAQPCTGPLARNSTADEDYVRKLRLSLIHI